MGLFKNRDKNVKNKVKNSKSKNRKKARKEHFKSFSLVKGWLLKTRFGKWYMKRKKNKIREEEVIEVKSLFPMMIYFTCLGIVICLLVLFVLSGGRNYFRLYFELDKLIETYDAITSNYYGDLSKEDLIDAAVDSMVDSVGDAYTTYSDVSETEDFNESIGGVYEGIGCSVSMNSDGDIIIVSVFDDSPASRAGLEVDDVILMVDGVDYTDKTSNDVSSYIKDEAGESVLIVVKRGDEEISLTVTREVVEIPTVAGEVYEIDGKKVGYIDISVFSSVTNSQFESVLGDLEDEGIEGLVIDVRDNNGGYLSTVTDIASMFLEKGAVIYQLEDDDGVDVKKDSTKESRSYPVAVLINSSSASASEILAAAIKDSYGGEVVGVNSYGKGTVQKTMTLSDGSMIKYTTQNWLTPSGEWINGVGVTPTLYVAVDSDFDGDNQLDSALNLIASEID